MRITRIAVTLAVPALLIGSLAACGSSAKSAAGAAGAAATGGGGAGAPALPDLGPKGELVAAAAVMQQAGSADISISSPDGSSGSGSGVYAWGAKPVLDLSEQQSGKAIKFRMAGGSSYLGVDNTQAAALGGKHWIDLSTAAGGIGDPFTALAVLMDPTAELTVAAQHGTLSKVGAEQVAGSSTTHYRSSMPAQDLVDQLPNLTDAQRKAAMQVATDGGATLITDFWVDGKHQLLQMREQNTDGSSPSSDGSAANASTIAYSNLGVKVGVSAPAASDQADPADAAKLLSSLN
ncbi:hypothetical protein [Kitasatospora sp. NBC_01266]|uniref:hypothetical protein n=1 Tax=Kitasatospora sp. NBC_01266 TaxID=2903572 RepID=UPI002E2ED31B|nr:hypothetical protein [Kitasatospora sp. NBC_01266]